MQKNKHCKRKCLSTENSNEYETISNLNNPYGYDFCYNARTMANDNYQKLQHLFNDDYYDKR